jgi:hypothetical protein
MQAELCGAARTVSHVSFDAICVLRVDLIVDQAVQETFSFVTVHFSRSFFRKPRPPFDVNPSAKRPARRPAARRRGARGGLPIADIALPTRSGRLLNLIRIASDLPPRRQGSTRIPWSRSGRSAFYSRAAARDGSGRIDAGTAGSIQLADQPAWTLELSSGWRRRRERTRIARSGSPCGAAHAPARSSVDMMLAKSGSAPSSQVRSTELSNMARPRGAFSHFDIFTCKD